MDRLLDRLESRSEFELVLRRVAHGARLLGLAWMISLGVLTLVDGSADRPGWVVVTVVTAVLWAISTAIMYRVDTTLGTARLTIGIDIALAVFAVMASRFLAESAVGIYGGYPVLVVVVAAIRSAATAWVAATILAVSTAGQLIAEAIDQRDVTQPVSQLFVYLAAAFIASWAIATLRRSDAEILEAREALARSQERTRISAHLHDSVLQTLALIQKASDRPSDIVALSRRQERELRQWLYADETSHANGLAEALRSTASDVEERYGVPIDVVVVGEVTDRRVVEPLVAASRECLVNAAKHSGAGAVSLYAEAVDGGATVFVRDRGSGFDPDAVPEDRHGISGSVRERLALAGGRSQLRTILGKGTEWKLEVGYD